MPVGVESGLCAACIAFEAAEYAEQRVDNIWTPEEAAQVAESDRAIPRCRYLKSFRDHAASGAFAHRCLCAACTYARLLNWPVPSLTLKHWVDRRAERALCGPHRSFNEASKIAAVTCPACRYEMLWAVDQPGEPTEGSAQLLRAWRISRSDVLCAVASWTVT